LAESGQKYRRYLDPRVLSRIGGLELRARLAVEGFFRGMHRSPYHGLSVEFVDHRAYTQGDDIRHVDWKVYGRTDKYYIKEYEEETNLHCMLVVDTSESMTFQSPDAIMSKLEYAKCIAASLAYLALRQRDSVGLAVFDEKVTRFVDASNNPGHWKVLIDELSPPVTGARSAKTSLRTVLDDLAERLHRRTLMILISDLLDDPPETLMGLRHLRYRKHEVIVFNVWDPAELRFDLSGPTMFDGLESGGRLMLDPQALRSQYREEVRRFLNALRGGCRKMHIDFVRCETSMALDATISAYLATRSSRVRHRASRVLGAG
jgi:uncharacterized protein (DUF58 family)